VTEAAFDDHCLYTYIQ